MLKKCLTVFITVIMLSQLVYSADFYSDSDSSEFNITAGLLDAINVIELDENTDMATTVTKGEFLKSAVRLFVGGENFISADYTEYVEMLGVDVTEITVNADNKVTYSYAVKAMLHGLGYDILVENDNYYAVAFQAGLLDNISYKDNRFITLEQQIKLFDNALDIKVMRMIKSGENVQSMDKTGTLLNDVLKLQKRTGVVTGTHETCLLGSSALKDGLLMIGDTCYQSKTDYSDFLGMNVVFYVDLDADEDVIVYLYNNTKKNDVITLESKDITGYKGNKYTYYNENNKKETIDIAKPFYVIYNGFAASDLNSTDMVPSYGNVKLIDNNKDELYDVVIITDYIIGKVSFVNAVDEKVYIETTDGNKTIILGDYDKYDIKIHNGSTIDYASIKSDDMVLVKLSRGNHYAYVGKINSVLNGTLESYSPKGETYELTIDGVIYETAKGCVTGKLVLGSSNSYYLENGFIIGVSKAAADDNFKVGYIVKALPDDMLGRDITMKIFNEDGIMLLTQTAPRVMMDNASGKTGSDVYNALCDENNTFVPQLIRYRLNADGNVNAIDTVYNYTREYRTAQPGPYESKDSFNLIYSSSLQNEGGVLYEPTGAYSGKFMLNTGFKIFQIPSMPATAEDKEFKISTAETNLRKESSSHQVDAFSFSGSRIYADVVVVRGSGVDSSGRYEGVIKSIRTVLDEDGSAVEEISIQGPPGTNMTFLNYDFTGEVGIYWNDSATAKFKYDVGDFVSCGWSGNKVNTLTMIYDVESGFLAGLPSGRNYGGYRYYTLSNVYLKEGSAIAVTGENLTPGMTNVPATECYNASSFAIFKASGPKDKVKVESATVSDIVDYMSDETGYSKVMMYSDAGYPWLIVIYDIGEE